ncbi:MAG TPA: hypothetical protein VF753_08860 [Terriglobales bacterium]
MSGAAVEILQRVNTSLAAAISRFQPEHTRASAIQAEELSALRKEIRCAANCIRELPPHATNEPALEKHLSDFRHHLEQLKQVLPALHARLLAEQARLSQTQTQINAAAAWVEANQRTL